MRPNRWAIGPQCGASPVRFELGPFGGGRDQRRLDRKVVGRFAPQPALKKAWNWRVLWMDFTLQERTCKASRTS